jgi:hypothetical protein
MQDAVAEYQRLIESFAGNPDVTSGQMFGKSCLKVKGKAFIAQHKENVVFKLGPSHHARALALPGAILWDPSGKGRPMKEWVAIPASGHTEFRELAEGALEYVSSSV